MTCAETAIETHHAYIGVTNMAMVVERRQNTVDLTPSRKAEREVCLVQNPGGAGAGHPKLLDLGFRMSDGRDIATWIVLRSSQVLSSLAKVEHEYWKGETACPA